jgi:hypothetical protein
MEVCEDSAPKYGDLEKCITSFSLKTGDRTLQQSGNNMTINHLTEVKNMHSH